MLGESTTNSGLSVYSPVEIIRIVDTWQRNAGESRNRSLQHVSSCSTSLVPPFSDLAMCSTYQLVHELGYGYRRRLYHSSPVCETTQPQDCTVSRMTYMQDLSNRRESSSWSETLSRHRVIVTS